MSNYNYFQIFRRPLILTLFYLSCLGAFRSSLYAQFNSDLVFVQVPVSDLQTNNEKIVADRYREGVRIVKLPADKTQTVNLTRGFYAACDPDVSFDGKTILFAGKKDAGDLWQIWRMDIDGSQKEQITHLHGDCLMPVHAGSRFYLNDPEPTPQIIFCSSAHGWKNRKSGEPVFSLYGSDLTGKTVHRLTFNLENDLEPDVLPNGRIVFSSLQSYFENGTCGEKFAFMAINNDGSDLMEFYGNHEPPFYKRTIHISNTDQRVYVIESDTLNLLGGGYLSSLSQRRPLHSYKRINSSDHDLYLSPVALPDGGLIASCCKKSAEEVYAIYTLDPATGKRIDRIYEEPGWHSVDMRIIQKHPKVKGRSNWLIPGAQEGVLYCLDSYRTNLDVLKDIKRGDIKFVRVIEGIPYTTDSLDSKNQGDNHNYYSGYGSLQRILGVAPVEKDGSFQIRIPAEIAVRFQMLNEDFMTISRQGAWIWAMGNENRGCIGCHEDRELSPPNVLVDAVTKPPVNLVISPDHRRTVDFRHNVAPLVQKKCATANCHVSGKYYPDFGTEHYSVSMNSSFGEYQMLVNSHRDKYIVAGSALKSPLMRHFVRLEKISEDQQVQKNNKSQFPRIILNKEEWLLFVEWIDLGALWDAKTLPAEAARVQN